MLLTLILLYEQSGSVQKDPHELLQSWKNVCMNEISWSWKQYVQRTHRIGVNLNDFASKLTVTSRSQRDLVTIIYWTQNDSRRTWQTINELTSRKSNISSIKELIVKGVSINKSTDLTNAFNEHFSTIGRKVANEIPLAANGDKSCLEYLNITDQRFCFTPTNSSQVFSLLNKLSKSKATGFDKISARLIRERADLICVSFCKIFNCSLTTGIFPDDWKCDKVTPLFKQGSSSDINNYRPISVISLVVKAFERIMYNQGYVYLSEDSIISKSQSGFHSIHSTVTDLLEATDSWAFDIER